MENTLALRPARLEDLPLMLEFIRALALHEGRPEACTATIDGMSRCFFKDKTALAYMLMAGGEAAGYAITCPMYSSFAGRCHLYLDDIFIRPELRGQGYGRAAMGLVAAEARRLGYQTLQWGCLDTNPGSLAFYEGLGARKKPHATTFYQTL